MFRLGTSSLQNAVHYDVTAALCQETIQTGLSSAFSMGSTSERYQVSNYRGRVEALGLIMVSSVLGFCADHLSSEFSVYLKFCIYLCFLSCNTSLEKRNIYWEFLQCKRQSQDSEAVVRKLLLQYLSISFVALMPSTN